MEIILTKAFIIISFCDSNKFVYFILAIPIGNIMLSNPKYTTLLSHTSLILPFVVMALYKSDICLIVYPLEIEDFLVQLLKIPSQPSICLYRLIINPNRLYFFLQ